MSQSLLVAAHGFRNKRPDYASAKIEDEYYSRNQNALPDFRVLLNPFARIGKIGSALLADFTIYEKARSR